MDSSPLITPGFISKFPGRIAPGRDTITFSPTLTLGAPHTIWVVFDPIFILVLDMKTAGASLATVLGNILGCIYYLYYFKYKDFLNFLNV